jgi:amino acid transporter
LKPNPQRHELRQNSVSFFGALAMSAAFMGPGVSIFYNIVPAAAVAGAAFPLSFLVSMIAILFVAASVVAFSRKIQSASFAFAYTSAGLGPKFGFMAGWIALLAYAMIAPLTYAGFGIMVSEFMQRQFAVQVSWIWFFVAVGVVVSLLSCFGVSHSTRTTLVFQVLGHLWRRTELRAAIYVSQRAPRLELDRRRDGVWDSLVYWI